MINYVLLDKSHQLSRVANEIIKNSLIVLAAICLVGFVTAFFFTDNIKIVYAIVALAALTWPHMHVMHHMYSNLNDSKK